MTNKNTDDLRKIEQDLSVLGKNPQYLTIENMNNVLAEIKTLSGKIRDVKENYQFIRLLNIYKSFLQILSFYMVRLGRFSIDFTVDQIPEMLVYLIGLQVKAHHTPTGVISFNKHFRKRKTDFDFKIEEVTISSDPSTQFPHYDENLILTTQGIVQAKILFYRELEHKTPFDITLSKIQSKKQEERHFLLSILSNLNKNYELIKINEGFRIIRATKDLRLKRYETTILKVNDNS